MEASGRRNLFLGAGLVLTVGGIAASSLLIRKNTRTIERELSQGNPSITGSAGAGADAEHPRDRRAISLYIGGAAWAFSAVTRILAPLYTMETGSTGWYGPFGTITAVVVGTAFFAGVVFSVLDMGEDRRGAVAGLILCFLAPLRVLFPWMFLI